MLVYTDKLTGVALDYAVFKLQGFNNPKFLQIHKGNSFHYSTNWELTGPIIQLEKICLDYWQRLWSARIYDDPTAKVKGGYKQTGSSPLVAAMRCYVTSKAGYQIEIPDEIYNAK